MAASIMVGDSTHSAEFTFCPSHSSSVLPLSPRADAHGDRARQISCGAAHTACATASGQLFVWGCGDGGRLGLGEERLGPQFEPILVEAFVEAEIRIGSVSCGNSHTLVRSVRFGCAVVCILLCVRDKLYKLVHFID